MSDAPSLPAWRYIGKVGGATAYECPTCMAIVHLDKCNQHDRWHSEVLRETSILATRITVLERDLVQERAKIATIENQRAQGPAVLKIVREQI